MWDVGHRKQQPSGRDDGIGPLFNGHIDFQIWAKLGLELGLARNFLLQSSAKVITGIPRANQKPTQDCLSRPQDSLSWLGLGAHEGYQWWQQTTSMLFQALRSCTNVQISWGSGGRWGLTGLISFAAYSWNTILRPVPRKMTNFKINFDTVELQKTYGKIKVF